MTFVLDFDAVLTVKLSDMTVSIALVVEYFLAEGAVVNHFRRMDLKL